MPDFEIATRLTFPPNLAPLAVEPFLNLAGTAYSLNVWLTLATICREALDFLFYDN